MENGEKRSRGLKENACKKCVGHGRQNNKKLVDVSNRELEISKTLESCML